MCVHYGMSEDRRFFKKQTRVTIERNSDMSIADTAERLKRPVTKTRECRRSCPSCLAFGLRATCSSPPVRTSASTISPRHAISKLLVSFDAALRSAARPHHTAQLKSPPQKATSRHSPRPGPWLCAVSGRSQRTETHLPPRRGCGHGRAMAAPMIPEAVNDLVVAGKPVTP